MFNDQFFIQLLILYNQKLFYFYTYIHIQRERETTKKFAYCFILSTHTHTHPTSILYISICNICPKAKAKKQIAKFAILRNTLAWAHHCQQVVR